MRANLIELQATDDLHADENGSTISLQPQSTVHLHSHVTTTTPNGQQTSKITTSYHFKLYLQQPTNVLQKRNCIEAFKKL
jgi:hypothetical protein